MRGDDEIPHGFTTTAVEEEGSECIGTCLSKVRSELDNVTPDEILHQVQAYCESQAIQDFCSVHGVNDTTFTWNPHLQCRHRLRLPSFRKRRSGHSRGKLSQHFWKSYDENPTLNLGLAFHGTAEANVPGILHHGLDPKYRRTQAFGNGEYFSKEPGLAATYRHDGHCLLVFLLLMPKDHEKVYNQKDRDIIVVPNLTHQLPVGVIRFESVDEHKIQHSQDMRLVQRHLKEVAIEADWQVEQAKLVREMTTLLSQQQIQQASQTLRQATKYHKLSRRVQTVLAMLVLQHMPDDAAQRETLFPSLPTTTIRSRVQQQPQASFVEFEEESNNNTSSIPALEVQAQKAWNDFLQMKMDPNRNILMVEEEHDRTLAQVTTTIPCAVQHNSGSSFPSNTNLVAAGTHHVLLNH